MVFFHSASLFIIFLREKGVEEVKGSEGGKGREGC